MTDTERRALDDGHTIAGAEAPAPAAFVASREAGLARLADFLPRAGRAYAARRNYDDGPGRHRSVSGLSPYIRHRLVSEAEVVDAALARHGSEAAAKFIDEVCWRTYWKGYLEHRPAVWDRYVADLAGLRARLATDRELAARYARAVGAATGIAPFDAWVEELTATGYLHNHARMWFASIWTHTLRLPWQLGADFFLRQLIDGDPASNTLSWRWVVGLHTAGKTYLARPDNIARYTSERFPVVGDLAPIAEPEREPPLPAARTLRTLSASPPPGPVTLLLTEDDLSPELWGVPVAAVTTIIVLDATAAWPDLAPPVVAFRRAALADACARAETHFARRPILLSLTADSRAGDRASPAWDATGTLVTAELPVGLTATAVRSWLQHQPGQPALHELRNRWDAAFWPHARTGFFKLREAIPQALAALGLPSPHSQAQADFDFGEGRA
ncbi:MAG: FAD-binding domain-containing protein [Hyphomicrobiaceae bacterium]|nr:FAD-binding domain-containing protein [Hyphomicrobiaceae bacterium]